MMTETSSSHEHPSEPASASADRPPGSAGDPSASAGHELGTRYDPSGIEAPIYARWLERDAFHVDAADADDPYVMVIPPPNVTAALHMGHGLNNTIQDIVIRYQRMRGRDAVWVPGTDHAGIATQNVVEQQLASEGLGRQDLGREKFLERTWEWVAEYGSRIIDQLKVMGCSCDWERTRFTLDEGLSRAVREVFVQLYEKGLIYRGNYIINWCPRCLTALSNEEAEHQEAEGKLYHLRYPLKPLADANGGGAAAAGSTASAGSPDAAGTDAEPDAIIVATTRPETMLGDTAVAVHPDDERHRDLIGREIEHPLTGRTIPIIADDYVDPEFGSGFVKITPAHDPNDFEIGNRHDLERIDVMNDEATMSDAVPEPFRGLDRLAARKAVVAALDEAGLLAKVEDHKHAVGHCYRCDTVVEPRLSLQWFVKMKPLAEPALAAYRSGDLRFHPGRYGTTYEHWLTNIRDWCISRQLWWGHRIPVWYCDDCDELTVTREDPDACPHCGGSLTQDPDVLDTWFSSWLWPFSTLGWPEETPDLRALYPTHTLSTAPEILFFWVARMVMAGIEFMGELPFTDVLMHGTVRDAQGRKMSKSLGNGIDPLEVVEQFGADAMRYTLVSAAAIGTDMQLDHADLEGSFRVGRNFANKIWNAVRFGLSGLNESDVGRDPSGADLEPDLEVADRWILTRFADASASITDSLDRFRLHDAAEETYQFVWGDFCDWYLELVKPRLRGDRGEPSRDAAAATLAHVLDGWLRLLHPVMPFITEELYCHLPGRSDDDTLLFGPWPTGAGERTVRDEGAAAALDELKELLGAVRNLRAEYGIDPGRKVELVVASLSAPLERALAEEQEGALALARLSGLTATDAIPAGIAGAHAVLRSGTELFLPLEGVVDIERERARITEEMDRLDHLLAASRKRLDNPKFTEQAPAEVVEREREKLDSFAQRRTRLLEKRDAFQTSSG